MTLPRILEPELMDTAADAREYDAMDHAAVNTQFVTDLLTALQKGGWSNYRPRVAAPARTVAAIIGPVPFLRPVRILDLGAGTAQIPIELARRVPPVHITAVDAAESMLALARKNVAAAGLTDRIEIVLADAKRLPFDAASFPVVISNSIVHHIAAPPTVLAEVIRVTAPGGNLFHRDLARPHDEAQLEVIVQTYAGDATPHQRELFADSLRAALTLDEVQFLIAGFGFPPETAQMTSDRHWTWAASKE